MSLCLGDTDLHWMPAAQFEIRRYNYDMRNEQRQPIWWRQWENVVLLICALGWGLMIVYFGATTRLSPLPVSREFAILFPHIQSQGGGCRNGLTVTSSGWPSKLTRFVDDSVLIPAAQKLAPHNRLHIKPARGFSPVLPRMQVAACPTRMRRTS